MGNFHVDYAQNAFRINIHTLKTVKYGNSEDRAKLLLLKLIREW